MTSDVTWRRLRQLVKKRDGAKCFHCGKIDEKGHCDHLVPLVKGGTDSILNLVWSCSTCNLEKGSKITDLLKGIEVSKEESFIKKAMLETLSDFLLYIIPPYPPYGGNFYNVAEYYFVIKEMSEQPRFIRWLRHRLYPISKDANWALICVEAYKNVNNIVNRIKPKDYVFSYTSCYICSSPVEVITKNGYIDFSWECTQGHKGEGRDMFAEGYLDNLLEEYLKWLKERIVALLEDSFIQGHILISFENRPMGESTLEEDLPDWLKD